ncbi:hypothetical protein OSB04_026930 [Centaurea solstitialis]|uniref:Transducin/WD40 repeat-like superfamily protein n=1 Tax=Centaurea solstitialis TaxID=347529 RepID=A0AA38W7Q8_9ASTR|nr:hypothetical protein OSB04_026930 [Centaurea solstitialis]
MEKYAVPVAQIEVVNPRPITRSQWKRSRIELTGKPERSYHHDVSPLLMRSYSEINMTTFGYSLDISSTRQLGVTALEFDSKGIYLASVTKTGCLTVHEFESLYCQSNKSVLRPEEDEGKHLLHISLPSSVDLVRWNPTNQDEVACSSLSNNEVRIFDIGYISSEPTEVLRKRPTVTVHGGSVRKGLSDIAFLEDNSRLPSVTLCGSYRTNYLTSGNSHLYYFDSVCSKAGFSASNWLCNNMCHDLLNRVLASDTCGAISIWDRRASDLPQTGLATNANSGLTSIQLSGDQCVYGASKSGFIYIWDLRGGRSSAAFQSHNEVHSSPVTSLKLASMLNKIGLLKAQSNILPKEIQSININPSCPYQLGFHLDDGWSGVLDMHDFQVTHIHCPPPPWLDETDDGIPIFSSRKPSWLPKHSIYAVGSSSSNGIHLLDFYPHTSSPCHVDHDESKNGQGSYQRKQNKFVPLSEHVTACTTHPLNGTIVAGTMEASLLMISQKHISCKKGDEIDAAES